MLTRRVPFERESAGEILMKHLTSPPDLSKLPFEFVPIVSKALSKNPAHRYRTMAEMARDVAALGGQEAPKPVPRPVQPIPQVLPVEPIPAALPVVQSLRKRVTELCGSMAMAALLAALLCTVWAAVHR